MLPGFFHDTLGERDRARADRPGARASSSTRFAEPLEPPVAARRRPHAATPATRPTRWPRRCRALSPRGLYWARRAPACGSAACCRTASRSATTPASIPASTLDYVYRNEPRGRGAARPPHRPQLSRLDRLARHPPAQAACRGAAARRRCERLRERGVPVRIIDIAAGHGRYVLEALDGSADAARLDPAARLQRHQRRGGAGADRARRASTTSRAFVQGRRLRPRRASPASSRGRRSASSPASTSCSPTTPWCAARSPASPRRSRPAATWSTPASPGIRSSS